MHILEVASVKWNEPSFDTAAEAIAYRSPRAGRAATDTASIRGATIHSGSYNDRELRLLLVDMRTLRIYLDAHRVEWELSIGRDHSADHSRDEPGPCLLQFANSQIGDSIWDRPSLLNRRVGHLIRGIWTGDDLLFLYVTGTETLMFGALERLPQRSPLLHWDETD
jgi:hypothetical protein